MSSEASLGRGGTKGARLTGTSRASAMLMIHLDDAGNDIRVVGNDRRGNRDHRQSWQPWRSSYALRAESFPDREGLVRQEFDLAACGRSFHQTPAARPE